MRYQPLPLQSYQQFAKFIRQLYKASASTGKEYLEHQTYLALFESAYQKTLGWPEKKASKVFIGLAVYVLEKINSEWWRSPEHRDKMYDLVMEHFNINGRQPIDAAERVVFLHKYDRFIEKTDPQNKHLSMNVNNVIESILKRDHDRINKVKTSLPTLEGMQAIIEGCYDKYKKKHDLRWFKSTTRYPMLRYMSFIDFACKNHYPHNNEDLTGPNAKWIQDLRIAERKVRMGLIVQVLTKIFRDHKRICNAKGNLISHGSDLYQIFCEELYISDVDSITDEIKKQAFFGLDIFISETLKGNPGTFQSVFADWKAHLDSGKANKSLVEMIGTDITFKKFETELNDFHFHLKKYVDKPGNQSWKAWGVTTVGSHLAKFGIMGGVGYMGAQVAARIGVSTLGGLAASVANPIFGMTAAAIILWTLINSLISDGIISGTQAVIFGWLSNRLDSTVDSTMTALVNYALSPTKEAFDDLINKLTPEDRLLFQDWINTLLALRIDTVPEKDKEQIRHIIGIGPGEKWKCKMPVREVSAAPQPVVKLLSDKGLDLDNWIDDDFKPAPVVNKDDKFSKLNVDDEYTRLRL